MGRQSTRHKYKTRKEKNTETARAAKLIILGLVALAFFMLAKNWRSYWAYYKTYFYE